MGLAECQDRWNLDRYGFYVEFDKIRCCGVVRWFGIMVGCVGNRRVISQGSREWMHGGVTVSHKGDQHNIQVVWSLGEGLVLLEVQARG